MLLCFQLGLGASATNEHALVVVGGVVFARIVVKEGFIMSPVSMSAASAVACIGSSCPNGMLDMPGSS